MFAWTLLLFYLHFLTTTQGVVVRTMYGQVRGQIREHNDKVFSQFLGIPFAAPPVGDLRFLPPQDHGGWGDSIRDALEYGPGCPQERSFPPWLDPAIPDRLMIFPQDEDCLHLNVWVTGDVSLLAEGSLPVFVFIHGGGFNIGSARMALGDVFVTQAQPIVMVAIQYRLGVMGFLTTGDQVVKGNNGFKDQSFALNWIQENIAAFGGDPDRVTISGQSAGAESVMAHMVSPMSIGLFQKASVLSSTPTWTYPRKEVMTRYFRQYARAFECDGDSVQAVGCLRTKPWEDIISKNPLRFAVADRVIDGEFITDEPHQVWSAGEFNDAELMIGWTSDDGTLIPNYLIAPGFDFAGDRSRDFEILSDSVDYMLGFYLHDDRISSTLYGQELKNRDDLFTVIKGRYYDTEIDALEKAREVLDCFRDGFFVAFSVWTANQVEKHHGNAYVYIFDHTTSLLMLDNPGGVRLGAPHSSDLPYWFGYGFSDPDTIELTNDELALTRSMMHALTSYASGEPSYLSINGDVIEWEKYNLDDKHVLTFRPNMTADSLKVTDQWQVAMDFWVAIRALAQWEGPDSTDAPATELPYPTISASCKNKHANAMLMITCLILAASRHVALPQNPH